jgi:hypothetical protein
VNDYGFYLLEIRYLTTHLLAFACRFAKSHGKYSEEDLKIELTHREPESFTDKSALFAVKCVRFFFDAGKCGDVSYLTCFTSFRI